jgi:hypothetical protein
MTLTQGKAKELFEYKNGGLYWKVRTARSVHVGDRFGSVDKATGYRRGSVFNKLWYEHRLVFLYHHGYLPKVIDHINRICDNNRIENLREATTSQNSMNRGKNRNNTSGKPGVSFDKRRGKCGVRVGVNGKVKRFGYYADFKEACDRADEIRKQYHGEFAPKSLREEHQ